MRPLVAYFADGQFTMTSTLMIEHGNRDGSFEGIKYEVKMRFENAIQSGHLKIRFQVAHGGYITTLRAPIRRRAAS